MLKHVQFFTTLWTVSHQAPLSIFFQARILSRLPFPPPWALSNPGIEPTSPESPALAGGFFTTELHGKHYAEYGFPGDAGGDARDSHPGSGRSPGVGNGNPLQYSCLKNPMEKGVWWTTVYRVAKSWTWLNTHTHKLSVIFISCAPMVHVVTFYLPEK